MPHHQSCRKRVRTSKKRNESNRAVRSTMKTSIKKVLGARKQEDAARLLSDAYSRIDRSAKQGVIHKNNAANKKARLAKFVGTLPA